MNVGNLMRMVMVVFMVMLANEAQAKLFKIATLSPEGSIWMQKLQEGASELSEKTGNRVTIRYYPGGVMGDDKAVLRKIQIGQLQGGALVGGSLAKFYSDNQIYSLPLKFRSFEEIDYVRKHLDQRIADGLEKGGFVTFGIAEGGFAYVMSQEPIKTVDDMRRQKVWIPDNDSMILEAVKAFDITPIPLPIADVRAGLQTGLINTVTIPPIGAIALQWHTQIKYLMNEPFLYVYGVLAIDKKAFKKLSSEDQAIFREIMGRKFLELNKINREDNVKALEALRNQGIEFITIPEEPLVKWHKDAASVPKRLIETERLSTDMVSTLENFLNEYRTKE